MREGVSLFWVDVYEGWVEGLRLCGWDEMGWLGYEMVEAFGVWRWRRKQRLFFLLSLFSSCIYFPSPCRQSTV